MLPVGIAATAVGVGSLGAALGLELARAGAVQDAEEEPVQTTAAEHVDRAETFSLTSRIMVVVGGALTAVGVTLIAVDLASGGDDEDAVQARVRCGLATCGLLLRGSF